ncbi:nuclear transport factor 2 family protein [Actinomadura scrupuli]|uniref:nuclear transport factor 2 family protein n=1 Tax=Actinomadura scrupuli TaxID=559629 RepID=UPI003D983680
MNATTRLMATFYEAFGRGDPDTMAKCYHPDAVFSDPIFPELRGVQVTEMWRMLLERSTGIEVAAGGLHGDDRRGRAHCAVRYTFRRTGRTVRNEIDARFSFADGMIIEHKDHFDFWHWSRQALGIPGLLLGWTPSLQRKVQASAVAGLVAFMDRWPS